MKYLKIQNKGELDIRLVALMGGTTKANDEYKIGQFGTGLKYTLAYLIRNNIDFHIFSGDKKVQIETVKEIIKDTEFNIICIEGHRTSITDKMGLEWTPWMIIRELWCNALDEGDYTREITEELTGEVDKTAFYIQLTNEFKSVIDDWHKYFVHEIEPLFSNSLHAIYPGGNDLRIYKNGVLIKEYPNKKSLFSYDMKYATINEMREYNGTPAHVIFKCLQNASKPIVQFFLENVNNTHYEGSNDMDYSWFENFGNVWKEAIGSAKIIHQEAKDKIEARGVKIDLAETVLVPKKVYEALTNQFEGIGALRVSSKINEFYETYSSESDEKIKQALVILEEAEYNFSPELKFIFGVFGDKATRASVNLDTKEVYVSENIAQLSLFTIAAILIEENEHFKTGLSDETRAFQQHFIDLYAASIFKNAKISI